MAYPATKTQLMTAVEGKTVEGWELSYFMGEALAGRRYRDLGSVMEDLESWLEKQG
jgi:hypothetical protein